MSVDACYSSIKMVYEVIVQKKLTVPTAVAKWTEMFEIVEDDWPAIYKQPYMVTRETKLQSLQYKIIHRIVPCRKWLHIQRVVDSPFCTSCNDKVDDLCHHFIECIQVKQFWKSLENWWNKTGGYKVKLTNKHIIFGFYDDNGQFESINFIILLAKWFIQKQGYLQCKIELYNFLVMLKHHLQVERYICAGNNKLNIFNKKWLKI